MSFLIFNCFDGSSKTTPFSIRKYTLIMPCSCRVSILVFFNKYPWRLLQCHFFRVHIFFPIVYFSVLSKITISALGASQSIWLIFNKQHPLSDKRFISCNLRISVITSIRNSTKHAQVRLHLELARQNLIYAV